MPSGKGCMDGRVNWVPYKDRSIGGIVEEPVVGKVA